MHLKINKLYYLYQGESKEKYNPQNTGLFYINQCILFNVVACVFFLNGYPSFNDICMNGGE